MRITFAFIVCITYASQLWAGSRSNEPAKIEPQRIVTFAKQVEKIAAQKGARAFILSRVGRPEEDLPKGIFYTHTAIAVYSSIELEDGSVVNGYAIHNLYQDDKRPNRSMLVTDYPVDFFWGAQRLKTGIVIPTPDLQKRLIDIIAQGKNKTLHNSRYSVLSNPFNQQFQNCTEHTLDVVNAAVYQTTDWQRLKNNAQAYFSPQRVHVSKFKLALGSMFSDDLTTADHKGKVYTTTFTSIMRYMRDFELSQESFTVFEDGSIVAIN
ncbi:DUF2145 domain-containing protein [Aliiglaciecola litoralis]|uniref:DUF2145 domain-containing protein n=1 Tax=Aliiglaciecola litoralis TaxID=582857 RepID=A0ABN1LFB4_9ALTE